MDIFARTILSVTLLLFCRFINAGVVPIQETIEPPGSFDPAKYGKVAVLAWNQSQPTPLGVSQAEAENFKQRNREIIAKYVREAAGKGAQMIITPEFSIVGYPYHPSLPPEEDNFQNRQEITPYVESIPGPSITYFSALAKELKVYLHVGLAEVEAGTSKYFNTVIALDPQGNVAAKYHKIHLYQVERQFLSEGTEPVTYGSAFGKVGIVVCSDIYSGFPMDEYKKAGLGILALSTSWAQWNTGMANFEAGAKWANAIVLAANQMYFPDSGVINPDGSDQSHIRQSSGLAYGYVPRK